MISYPTKKKIETPPLRMGANSKIPLNGGLNLQFNEGALNLTQSPYIENLNADDRGTLIKRFGQTNAYTTSLGSGGINGIYPNYKGNKIIAHGTKLYTQNGNNQPVEIYSGLANSKAFLFVFNGILYLRNGTNYIQYDGSTVKNVDPYIPTITQGRKPDGSQSTLKEPLNLYTGYFKDSFSSNDTKDYKLSFDNLNEIGDVYVNGVKKTLTTDYTIDLVGGWVHFVAIIATGNPNNVLITGRKDNPAGVQQVLKCTRGIEFASRMFFCGNPDYPNRIWKTGLTDSLQPNYFPASGFSSFDVIGNGDDAVTGFVTQYDKLVIFKERSIYFTFAETQSTGDIGFPIKLLNSQIGCDMPDTIQLINNNPTFCNTYNGVYIIVSTLIEGEKNVLNVSSNINGIIERPGLLQEDINDLKKATSIDYMKKYYLCVKNHVYVWDYDISFKVNNPETLTWFYYTNVNAGSFFISDNDLFYSDRDNGMLVTFVNAANDFGQPISAIWKSKLMDFNYPDYMKNISDIWLTTRANSNSSLTIKYFNNSLDELDSITVPASITKSFSWDNFDWDNFTWEVQRYAPTIHKKIRLKNIAYFQIELSNNVFNENLSIISLIIKYQLGKRVK